MTVAAIVAREGRYLVVEEETAFGLRLNQPAGHLDPGEGLIDAVIRETREETARTLTPSGLQGVYLYRSRSTSTGELVTYLRFAFLGTVGEPIPGQSLDTGIVRAFWMSVDELRASADRHRSPLVLQCVEDHVAGRAAAPLDLLSAHASALGHP